jgi:uncharacterized protein (UPF0248 family)
MPKKGKIKEIIDYALIKGENEVKKYKVTYREFDTYVTIPLKEFMSKDQEIAGVQEKAIPFHRIIAIYKNNDLVFSRPKPN